MLHENKEIKGVHTDAEHLFTERGWIRDGKYTDDGLTALAHLLEILPPIHKEMKWGPVFLPLMRKLVPASIELVIVRDGEVLLTHRDDPYFNGLHTPGSYISPGETWQEAASRVAKNELGCDVTVLRYLTSFLNTDNPRFVDVGNLVLCEPVGEPKAGTWFSHKPSDLIPVHEKYWPFIAAELS